MTWKSAIDRPLPNGGVETEVVTHWASEHFGDLAGEHDYTLVMETGQDEHLARKRVARWREKRPDVESRLLRREVEITYKPWTEAES